MAGIENNGKKESENKYSTPEEFYENLSVNNNNSIPLNDEKNRYGSKTFKIFKWKHGARDE